MPTVRVVPSQHKCANCEYWNSKIEVDHGFRIVSVDAQSEGVCAGQRHGRHTLAVETCSGWRFWIGLKY
jgi:hypothetical protein